MGQKVNPIGMRLGMNRTWDSRWCTVSDDYAALLHEDLQIRGMLLRELRQMGVSRVVIERPHRKCLVTIHSSRPGAIVGKQGADIDTLRRRINNLVDPRMTDNGVVLNIVEVSKPETNAQLIADSIAQQLERRVGFRRAMKRAVTGAMRLGALGIRINCGGRLGGAEIARTEWYREGRVPLHTLRADIDYGTSQAHTAYGVCGIKVWVFKGEIMEHNPMAHDERAAKANLRGAGLRGRSGAREGGGVEPRGEEQQG